MKASEIDFELSKLEMYINAHVEDKLTQQLLLSELNLIRTKLVGSKQR